MCSRRRGAARHRAAKAWQQPGVCVSPAYLHSLMLYGAGITASGSTQHAHRIVKARPPNGLIDSPTRSIIYGACRLHE